MRATDFERTVGTYRLHFTPDRHGVVEDMRFPRMRVVVRKEMERLGRPPTQDEFARACIIAWPGPFPRHLETAICARLARAYASLIRECHFGLVLREVCNGCITVHESDQLDLANGIDFAVEGETGRVGIAVLQNTRRAWAFNDRKSWRRAEGWNVVSAELGFENRKTCGDFWLFDPTWVKQFVDEQVLPLISGAA